MFDLAAMRERANSTEDELLPLLLPHDLVDLAGKVAALQLVPQNAGRLVRLRVLAECASRLSAALPRRKIPRDALRRLCNDPPLGDSFWSLLEDPPENPFTSNVTFFGGSYVVFPGIVDDAVQIIQLLIKTIVLNREPLSDGTYVRWARSLIRAVLLLSNAIAIRAGLSRRELPQGKSSKVVVPEQSVLRQLVHAATFSEKELATLLAPANLPLTILDQITQPMGNRSPANIDYDNLSIFAKPVVIANGTRVVIAPGELLGALRHQLLCMARARGVISELAERFGNAAWDDACHALSQFNIAFLAQAPDRPAGAGYIDGLFVLDADKSLYLQLVSDDFSDYDCETVNGQWEIRDLTEQLKNRQAEIETDLFGSPGQHHPNENFVLILIQPVGRAFLLGLGTPLEPFKSPRLLLTLADLETISEIEPGDPLLLWNFARASERIRDTAKVFQTSTLDEFSLYRSKGYSYYLSDDPQPDLITIAPGSGAQLRFDAQKERDYHGVPALEANKIIEITSVHGNPAIPIYGALSQVETRSAFLVEGLPILIWVTGPEYSTDAQRDLHPIYSNFGQMISYWLWQFTPSLAPMLTPMQGHFEKLIITLQAEPSPHWFREASPPSQFLENDLVVQPIITEPGLALAIRPSILERLARPDNAGERYFMERVIKGLHGLIQNMGMASGQLPNDDDIAMMIDRHAPLGLKKQFIVVGKNLNPVLDDSDLPDFRKVSPAAESILLDELSEHLREECHLVEGPIPDANRGEVLQKVVDFCFDKLERLVATLRSSELLALLIAQQEANVYETADRRFKIPTRMACFSTEAEMVEMLSKEMQEVNTASIATRFVIEYVAAQPPSGPRPMSYGIYDQLLAIAAQLITWAYHSDLIHFGITDIKLEMLPSGRWGVDHFAFKSAEDQFVERYSLAEIGHAVASMPRYWPDPLGSPVGEPPEAVDKGFKAEFGYSLHEFFSFVSELHGIGMEVEGPVKHLSERVVIEKLRAGLGWSEEKTRKTLSDLVLGPRKEFLVPTAPFERHDVYPWRFTRPLSHIRRPLIRLNDASDIFLVWGSRQLYQSGWHVLNIVLEGRLQAKSSELRHIMAEIHRKEALDFNNRVAEAFQVISGAKVSTRVRKICGKRIQKSGCDLGDIDVLVVYPKKCIVLSIECKDLEVARNPREYAHELTTLFLGDESTLSTVAKHERRTEWLRENIDGVLADFQITRDGDWQVEPLIVVSEELFSPHLYPSRIPVISFGRLTKEYLLDWR